MTDSSSYYVDIDTKGKYQALDQEAGMSRVQQRINESDSAYISLTPKRHMGRTIGFFYVNGEPLLSIGPHWILFVCTWLGMIAFGVYVAGNQAPGAMKNWLIVVIVLQALIYLLTALKNPGIMSAHDPCNPSLKAYEKYPNFCSKCRILKDKTTMHCSLCDICIRGYDHHCPWTGKCIGKGNILPFYLFLLSTCVYFAFCMICSFHSLKQA